MKQYEEVFFSVLRAALWKTPVDVPEGFNDWGKVMMLAKAQTLTGLVGDVLLTTPDIRNTLAPKFVTKLLEIPLENMGTHSVLNNTLILVVTELRKHGIDPVLLKGQGIARYYPVPELRQCGDIDLYVGLKNYEKAYDALVPIASEIDPKSALEVGKHFHLRVGTITIEVHRYATATSLVKLNKLLQEYALEGLTSDLKAFDFAGTSVNTPADNFNVFFIFYHLYHHFMSGGIGLRQFCDLILLLHSVRNSVSHEYLQRILNDMRLMEPWQVFGCLMVDYLGASPEDIPFYDSKKNQKVEHVLKHIFKEGNFGKQAAFGRKRTDNYIYEKWLSFKYHIERYLSLIFVFPKLTLMELWNVLTVGLAQVFHDLTHKQK